MNRPIGDTPSAAIACGTRTYAEWDVNRDFYLEIYLEIDRTMEQGVVR
jgi:hypothetical protein